MFSHIDMLETEFIFTFLCRVKTNKAELIVRGVTKFRSGIKPSFTKRGLFS